MGYPSASPYVVWVATRVSLFLNRGERENLDRRVPKLENVAYFNNSKCVTEYAYKKFFVNLNYAILTQNTMPNLKKRAILDEKEIRCNDNKVQGPARRGDTTGRARARRSNAEISSRLAPSVDRARVFGWYFSDPPARRSHLKSTRRDKRR